jgi:hypothetical protein
MTQGILQGESIPKLATRLAKEVGDSDRKAAIRNARTMATGAQNAGRVDSYKRAEDMGIEMEQEWRATLDMRTRHEHIQLDGQRQKVGEPFTVDGYEILFPGDPSAEGFLVWNCRCTLRGVVAGLEPQARKYRDESALEGLTYDEWKAQKKSESNPITLPEEKGEAIAESYRNEYRKGGKAPEQEEEPKYKDVTNRKEAYESLDTMFGSISTNVKGIDEKVLCAQVNQLQKLNSRFGAITENNSGYFTASPQGKAMGYAGGRFAPDPNGNLKENTNLGLVARYYKDKDTLIASEKRGVEAFWSMPCADDNLIIYTVTHEYGHILEQSISIQRTDYDKLKENVSKLVSPSASQIRDVYKKAEKDCAKDIWNELIDIAHSKNPNFSIKDNLSEYGRTNHYEAFAEAFANSQLGKPNELGDAMNEWLKKEGF